MSIFQSGFLTAGQPLVVATLEFLLVGGGGGGGSTNQSLPARAFDAAGGGGAGGYVTGSLNFYEKQPSINVIVGASGSGPNSTNADGFAGGETSFYTFSAAGGGAGGYDNAGDGASGGGGGVVLGNPRNGATGTVGQGNNGGGGRKTGTCPGVSCIVHGGGGGGANSTGSYDTGAGGQAKAWLDGKYYSSGGNGSRNTDAPIESGLYGNGGPGRSDGAFLFNCQGQPGYFKIRYTGSVALFTGGTTEISGGYVYHAFTSSGVFDYNLYP